MEKRCSDGVRAIAQLLHTIWPVGPVKPIYSVQSIMGAMVKRRESGGRRVLQKLFRVCVKEVGELDRWVNEASGEDATL